MRRVIGARAIKPGDRIVFYVSQGSQAGYWGTAKVTSELFSSQTVVWRDDSYPFRFSLTPDAPLRPTPITRDLVMSRLGAHRLKYLRQAGIIRLTADEFRTIAGLLKSKSPPHD